MDNEDPYTTFGMSADINELAAALSKAQAVIQHAGKNATNPHLKSRYADLSSVLDACREPLASNGLSVSQMPSASPVGVELRTMLMHTSGQYLWSTLKVPLGKQDAQGVGSALTYARRYALSAMVGVGTDDDDGDAASQGRQTLGEAKAARARSGRRTPPDPTPGAGAEPPAVKSMGDADSIVTIAWEWADQGKAAFQGWWGARSQAERGALQGEFDALVDRAKQVGD